MKSFFSTLLILFFSANAMGAEIRETIQVSRSDLTNQLLNIKRKLELAGAEVTRDSALIEVSLLDVVSVIPGDRAYLEVEAGSFFLTRFVDDRARDLIFHLDPIEVANSVGAGWTLRIDGSVQLASLQVVYETGNGSRPEELELIRYFKTRGDDDFRVTSEPIDRIERDYQHDLSLGFIFNPNSRERNTRPLYECRLARRDYFLSVARSCEGQEFINQIGRIYESEIRGSIPLYRCFDGVKHSASTRAGCEGLGRNEHILGYIL